MINSYKKILVLSALVTLVLFTMIATDFGDRLSLSRIQKGSSALKKYADNHYVPAVLIFILTYVLVNLWFPAAAVLTLLAGFLFGTIMGAIYVDTAATLGAAIAFAASRNFAGKWIQHKWNDQLQSFNQAISKYGSEYLLAIRMIPVMPYFLVNALAGLTKIRFATFAWTTALGSVPGILIYCYAGQQLLNIKSVEHVLTPGVMISFVLLAGFIVLVVAVRWALIKRRS